MTLHTPIDVPSSGYYWKAPKITQTDEVHPELLAATADRSGLVYFVAHVFNAPGAIPLGYINLALDESERQVCALYEVPLGMEDCATPPTWFASSDSIEHTIAIFADRLDSYGVL